MTWIELHGNLFTHRKTLLLAQALEIPTDTAAVKMIQLWCWCIDNAEDGNLAGFTPATIARVCSWEGDPVAFVAALVDAGFLDTTKAGTRIHDWHEYAGKLVDYRRRDRDRKRKTRTPTVRGTSGGHPADVPPTSNGHTADVLRPSDVRPADSPRTAAGMLTDVVRTSTGNRNRNQNRNHTETETGAHPVVVVPAPASTSDDDDATGTLSPSQQDDLTEILGTFPEITDLDHVALLAGLVAEYSHVDHHFEARKCRARIGSHPSWATVYADWIASAKRVRYKDATSGPPYELPAPPDQRDPLTEWDAAELSHRARVWERSEADTAAMLAAGTDVTPEEQRHILSLVPEAERISAQFTSMESQ